MFVAEHVQEGSQIMLLQILFPRSGGLTLQGVLTLQFRHALVMGPELPAWPLKIALLVSLDIASDVRLQCSISELGDTLGTSL